MTEFQMECRECRETVEIRAEATILRVDGMPATGELLFRCPSCETPDVLLVAGDTLSILLLAGAPPLTLSEPTADEVDLLSPRSRFDWDDLLDWHEQLDAVETVVPWE